MLTRYPDWPLRLAHSIEARRSRPFAWGTNDCAIFAADMIEAITGRDFAIAFRGRYKSKAGSVRMLRAHGWADLADLADAHLKRCTDRPQRGDVVLYAGRYGAFLGVYWAGEVYGPGADGVSPWPADPVAILAIWSVG